MPEPLYTYNKKRNQYLSTAILSTLMGQKEYASYEKILGIVDHDLFVPELTSCSARRVQRLLSFLSPV